MPWVATRRSRTPNRLATRRVSALRAVARDGGSSVVGRSVRGAGGARSDGPGEVVFGEDFDVAETVVAIACEAVGAVGAARHALAAELSVSGLLRMVELAAPPEATGRDRAAAREDLLGELIGWAVSDASPAALAFLRVVAALGEASTRIAASAAAEQLAAAGVADRRWAAIVGRPRLVRAWWYGDVFGHQESVNLLFDYAHREHCVCVLIDHRLGGGVKDCWISEGRVAGGLRARSAAEMAASPVALFEDLDPRRAAQSLRAALANATCPQEADQIRDVAANLEILRARVADRGRSRCADELLRSPRRPAFVAERVCWTIPPEDAIDTDEGNRSAACSCTPQRAARRTLMPPGGRGSTRGEASALSTVGSCSDRYRPATV
jgi:hypothetical protein